jgi:uncharacterized membrane-anchored protein
MPDEVHGPAAADGQFAAVLSKVPAATLGFWVLKLIATTVGEIGGNLLSMNMGLGYLTATLLLFSVFGAFTALQVAANRFHPALYWATIVASTTAGTTLADFADRSLGIGYTGGSLMLLGLVLASLLVWKLDEGRVSADVIVSRRTELHYWLTITFSQTLGTALGDWFADTAGLGYGGSTIVFSIVLAGIAALYFYKAVNPVVLFWTAFIVTRPFGAVFGNLFDKPVAAGGYGFNRFYLVAFLIGLLAAGLAAIPQRAKAATAREA